MGVSALRDDTESPVRGQAAASAVSATIGRTTMPFVRKRECCQRPRLQALTTLVSVSALAAAGEPDRARILAEDAETLARSLEIPGLQAGRSPPWPP